ncbi:MAG: hypothetical protein GF329_04600 [Candidatus Lokiarchaeota archaeon]|nr:hypothetical protein [Candidatus Lokiarchaeota archaeon]
MENESFLRRKFGPRFLKKQLKMTYKVDEFVEIIKQSRFADNFKIEKITLSNLSIWLRIVLLKKE